MLPGLEQNRAKRLEVEVSLLALAWYAHWYTFWLERLTDSAALGAFDADFWRKTAYLAHKFIAEE